MNPMVLPLAVVSALGLGGLLFAFLVLDRARTLVSAAERRARATQEESEAALRSVREAIDTLAAEVRQMEQQTAAAPPLPRPGLNLSKRSQALRMYRRGESREQIAASLQVPVQEVDLLLKVHRIVLSNV